jgi:quercetin dioxygenase-like cupin family protein
MAVISGDPSKPGPFTVRVQLPAGYRIPPHWHSTDEHLTVLSGTLGLGMGENFDDKGLQNLTTGAYVALPATMRHYVMARTPTTIQVHSTGPFDVTYVNPADDPRKK